MLDWKELIYQSDEELANHDIAEVHLACAAGLPDAGKVDVALCLDRLDYFARRVQSFTESRTSQFHRKRWDFNNSEAYFRILCMVTVLQRDLGVRYNPAKIPDDVPRDTADRFIHGVLFGEGGSCGSLAVVYTAVGRRLGYPLKLVHARRKEYGHLFPRWDDPHGERLNIEATNQGVACYPDDYYRTGRFELDPEIERRACLLLSMTPREELACFLAERGQCCLADKDYRRTVESFAWASALAPRDESYLAGAWVRVTHWEDALNAHKPLSFPRIHIRLAERRFPETLPVSLLLGIFKMEVMENLLTTPVYERKWWEPLRNGRNPEIPSDAFVDVFSDGRFHVRFQYTRSAQLCFSVLAGAE